MLIQTAERLPLAANNKTIELQACRSLLVMVMMVVVSVQVQVMTAGHVQMVAVAVDPPRSIVPTAAVK